MEQEPQNIGSRRQLTDLMLHVLPEDEQRARIPEARIHFIPEDGQGDTRPGLEDVTHYREIIGGFVGNTKESLEKLPFLEALQNIEFLADQTLSLLPVTASLTDFVELVTPSIRQHFSHYVEDLLPKEDYIASLTMAIPKIKYAASELKKLCIPVEEIIDYINIELKDHFGSYLDYVDSMIKQKSMSIERINESLTVYINEAARISEMCKEPLYSVAASRQYWPN
jgi:hypothetical protein